jgi:hypothetical protein
VKLCASLVFISAARVLKAAGVVVVVGDCLVVAVIATLITWIAPP